MNYQLHKKEEYSVSRWMGGEPREMANCPATPK